MNAGEDANDGLLRERFLLRSQVVLDDAWMICQQLCMWKVRDVPPHRNETDKELVKKLKLYLDQGEFEKLEQLAEVKEKKMMDYDNHYALTLKSAKCFNDGVKLGIHLPEEEII